MWTWKLANLLPCGSDDLIRASEIAGGARRFKKQNCPASEIDNHLYEVILPDRPCRLFFDIECSQIPLRQSATGDSIITELVKQVEILLGKGHHRVLESGGPGKMSYHVIFPDIVFTTCHKDMHDWVIDFVAGLDPANVLLYRYRVARKRGVTWDHCIDMTVYTRYRSFRMPYQTKCGSLRVMKPQGSYDLESYLVQPHLKGGISYSRTSESHIILPSPVSHSKPPPNLSALSLLKTIPYDLPYDPWYKIGAAFKNLGGAYSDFEKWSLECSRSDWDGWKNMRLGLPTLLKYSSHFTGVSGTATLFSEAFGLNPQQFGCCVKTISKKYTTVGDISGLTSGVIIKSRTGTGKSTLAFEVCRNLLEENPEARILYLVSSRALAWSSVQTFNDKWTEYMFDKESVPFFTCYMQKQGPLSSCQLLCCSIQSCWRTMVNRSAYDLIVIDEISSCLEDACSTTVKQQRACFEQLKWCLDHCGKVIMMDAHISDLQVSWATTCLGASNVTLLINSYSGPPRILRKTEPPLWGARLSEKKKQVFTGEMVNCWRKKIKTCLVCNSLKYGSWLEDNFLNLSLTGLELAYLGLPLDVVKLCCSFLSTKPYLKYSWIHKHDKVPSSELTSSKINNTWPLLDHLQYTSKITSGLDYCMSTFQVGFCYTSVGLLVPRKLLQQIGRIRSWKPNSLAPCPVMYMALNTSYRGPLLNITGLNNLIKYRDSQKNLSSSYYATLMGKQAHMFEAQFCEGMPPEWADAILRLHNERETFAKYPHAALSYVFTEDGWTIDSEWSPQPFKLGILEDPPQKMKYPEIPQLSDVEFELLSNLPHSFLDSLKIKKYCFCKSFNLEGLDSSQVELLWSHFTPQLVANIRSTMLESPTDNFYDTYLGKYLYSQQRGSILKMKPLQVETMAQLAQRAGFRGALSSNVMAKIPSRNFKSMMEYCRTLRTSGRLKKVWNIEVPQEIKHPDLWTLKTICSKWGGFRMNKVSSKIKCPHPSQMCTLEKFNEWLTTSPARVRGFQEMFHLDRPTKDTARLFLKGCRSHWFKNNKQLMAPSYLLGGPKWSCMNP